MDSHLEVEVPRNPPPNPEDKLRGIDAERARMLDACRLPGALVSHEETEDAEAEAPFTD